MKPLLMSSSSPVEVESDPYSVAQTIALMALGRRAKSRGELFSLLKKRGIEEEVANAVLFRLQEQGFINDHEFARYWCESRQRTKKVSKRIIAFVEDSRFYLVEKLTSEIVNLIRTEFNVPWVRVTLNKKGAISGASDVGIIIERGSKQP